MNNIDVLKLWRASGGDAGKITIDLISNCNVSLPDDFEYEIYVRRIKEKFEVISFNNSFADEILYSSSEEELLERVNKLLD